MTVRHQALSKRTFTSNNRIAVALAAYSFGDASMTYDEVVARSGVSRTAVHSELRYLVDVGALQRVEVGRNVHHLVSRDDPFWGWLLPLVARDQGTTVEEVIRTGGRPDGRP